MKLIIFCSRYTVGQRFLSTVFPYIARGRHFAAEFVIITNDDDMPKVDGIERNTMYVVIDKFTPYMKECCNARFFNRVTFNDWPA